MSSFKTWLLLEENKPTFKIPASAIKIHLPPTPQQTNYTCGTAAFRAICKYFNLPDKAEDKYADELNSDPKDGTSPKAILRLAKEYGIKAVGKKWMTVEELQKLLDNGIPVICDIQAWGDYESYKKNESGHYVVAIGYDDDNLYFMDPVSTMKGKRGWLSKAEFSKRWHDCDKYTRFGIAMYKPGKKEIKHVDKAKKID